MKSRVERVSARVGRDPVCGMMVRACRSAGSRTIGEETFYFCSRYCLEQFDNQQAAKPEPERQATGWLDLRPPRPARRR